MSQYMYCCMNWSPKMVCPRSGASHGCMYSTASPFSSFSFQCTILSSALLFPLEILALPYSQYLVLSPPLSITIAIRRGMLAYRLASMLLGTLISS